VPPSLSQYARRLLLTLAAIGLAVVIWRLVDVVVLVFAGCVLAIVLNSLARVVERFTPLRGSWALATSTFGLLVVLVGLAALLGWRVADQLADLTQTVSHAWEQLHTLMQRNVVGRAVLSSMSEASPGTAAPVSRLTHAAAGAVGAAIGCIVIVFVGLFLAADPRTYQRGLLSLLPPAHQSAARETIEAVVLALRHWLAGVAAAMLCVGVITGVGLWLLGVPLALSLALLAGLLEFVPYIGPIVSAVPAVLVGFAMRPSLALEVAGLYLAVHLVEGYILVPYIQKKAVSLPPALAITAVVIFGELFGPLGIMLAHPLMVTVLVLARRLYIPRISASHADRNLQSPDGVS
jgi:predicted PurR-regulated permease PerM